MNVLWAFLVIAAATGVAVAALLLIRRRAPDGGYFNDGDRAAGVFGVLATGFSVLLGFIIFLAFTSYDHSRTGAEREALMVVQQVEHRAVAPGPTRRGADGRAHLPWAIGRPRRVGANARRHARRRGQPLGCRAFPHAAAGGAANREAAVGVRQVAREQTSEREEARLDCAHGAVGVIPGSLWIVLFFVAAVIFVYTLFFADSGERAAVQALLIGSVVAVMASLLLLLRALDQPFHSGGRPRAERDAALAATGRQRSRRSRLADVRILRDDAGRPVNP